MEGQVGFKGAQTRELYELIGKAMRDEMVRGFSDGDMVLTAQPGGAIYVAFEGESYLIAEDGTTTTETED